MASTTFVNYQTVIDAGWLNDVNSAVYSGTFQASTITPTNVTSSGAISGATVAGTTSVTTPIVKSGTSLTLQTNGSTTAVTIDTAQNVGVGVTPSAWGGSYKTVELPFGSFAGYSTTEMDITQNSYQNGTNYLYKTTNYASLNRQASGAHYWFTAPSGTAGNAVTFTQAMTLDNSGNLLVGRTSASGTSAGIVASSSGTLKVFGDGQTTANTVYNAFTNGNSSNTDLIEFNVGQYQRTCIYVRNSGSSSSTQANHITFQYGTTPTNAGYITSIGAVTAYSSASDYRLKTNVAPMANSLVKIAQLKPCTFNWIENNAEGQGFIAHELQEIFPDAVVGVKDELDDNGKIKPQAVDTSFLIATLVSAIQELSAKVTALEAKVGA